MFDFHLMHYIMLAATVFHYERVNHFFPNDILRLGKMGIYYT